MWQVILHSSMLFPQLFYSLRVDPAVFLNGFSFPWVQFPDLPDQWSFGHIGHPVEWWIAKTDISMIQHVLCFIFHLVSGCRSYQPSGIRRLKAQMRATSASLRLIPTADLYQIVRKGSKLSVGSAEVAAQIISSTKRWMLKWSLFMSIIKISYGFTGSQRFSPAAIRHCDRDWNAVIIDHSH